MSTDGQRRLEPCDLVRARGKAQKTYLEPRIDLVHHIRQRLAQSRARACARPAHPARHARSRAGRMREIACAERG